MGAGTYIIILKHKLSMPYKKLTILDIILTEILLFYRFVIYDMSKIRIRYLVQVKFEYVDF